jgi:peptidyl-prolyl cis-trans isomerase B (cyclophilin B)
MTVKYTDDDDHEHTGDIILELDPNAAPITVENFTKLVSSGFYTGLNFHRVIEDFMIQGGAPKDTDTTRYQTIKGEFSTNGVNNPILHERGVISMARADAPNSASTQFFIVHKTSPHLDGKYAAFGKVISGMDLVDGIATMSTNSGDKPLKDAIIVSAKLIDKP